MYVTFLTLLSKFYQYYKIMVDWHSSFPEKKFLENIFRTLFLIKCINISIERNMLHTNRDTGGSSPLDS